MLSRILKLVALATYLVYSAGCSTGGGIALTACLSDPPSRAMLCKNKEAKDISLPKCVVTDSRVPNECDLPWEESGEMVCMPRGDYRYLMNRALK